MPTRRATSPPTVKYSTIVRAPDPPFRVAHIIDRQVWLSSLICSSRVFPTRVGVNRRILHVGFDRRHFPHACEADRTIATPDLVIDRAGLARRDTFMDGRNDIMLSNRLNRNNLEPKVSPRLPRLTAAEVERVVKREGWYVVRQSGSHRHFAHYTKSGIVTIPIHAGETLHPKTLRSIMEQAELSEEAFRGRR